jgi:hypothetical protein
MDWDYALMFGAAFFATIPVTALLCRYGLARKKSVSYGTMIAGACIATLVWLTWVSWGQCFTLDFWSELGDGKHTPGSWWMRITGFVACICALPAFGVVAYYQRGGKKDQTQAGAS